MTTETGVVLKTTTTMRTTKPNKSTKPKVPLTDRHHLANYAVTYLTCLLLLLSHLLGELRIITNYTTNNRLQTTALNTYVLVTVPTNMPTTIQTTKPSTRLTYISSPRTSPASSTVPTNMASSRQVIEPPAEPTNMSFTRPTILLHESTVPSHQLRYPLQFYLLGQLMCQLLC